MTKREFHPPHIYTDNACYFLTARIARQQRILSTDTNRTLLRDVLKEAVSREGIRLYAWVILADHYHLLLKTGEAAPLHKFVKRLHSQSAILLNKQDATPGRKVWYQYWDRFPRNERDFWSYFNYIHINPIKHGYVQVPDGILLAQDQALALAPAHVPDVHQCLAQYPHSSYHFYLREHGAEFLTDAWLRHPIPDYFNQDLS